MGYLSAADVERVARLVARIGVPVTSPDLGRERWLELMGHDKKVQGGRLKFILLRSLGDAFVGEAPDSALAALLSGPAIHA